MVKELDTLVKEMTLQNPDHEVMVKYLDTETSELDRNTVLERLLSDPSVKDAFVVNDTVYRQEYTLAKNAEFIIIIIIKL